MGADHRQALGIGTVPAAAMIVSRPCQGEAVAKAQYLVAASIDGFIADTGNSLEWLFEAEVRATKDAKAARRSGFASSSL